MNAQLELAVTPYAEAKAIAATFRIEPLKRVHKLSSYADELLRRKFSGIRRQTLLDPKPRPKHPKPSHMRTTCLCGNLTERDASGCCLYWNSDGGMCGNCYAIEQRNAPTKKSTCGIAAYNDGSAHYANRMAWNCTGYAVCGEGRTKSHRSH